MLLTRRVRITTKIFFILLALLLVVVGGLHFLLTAGGVDEQLRHRIEATLSRQLQREVHVGQVTVSPFFNVLELREVVVKGREGIPPSRVDRVELYLDLGLLFGGVLAVQTVVIRRPVIYLSEGLLPLIRSPSDKSPLAVGVEDLQIREGAFTVRSQRQAWSVRGVDADFWQEKAQVRGEVRVAEGVLHLPGQSVTWGNVEALVVLTEQELRITRLGIDVGDGNVGLDGRVTDPFGEPTLELRLTAGLPLTLPSGLPERIRLEGQLTGSTDSPRFQGGARLEGAQWPDLGVTISADREGMQGEQVRLLEAQGDVSGGFTLRWKDWSYHASVEGRGLELGQPGTPLHGALRVTGVLALQAVAEGRGLTRSGLTAQTAFRVLLRRLDRSRVVGRADGLIKAEKGQVSLKHFRVDLPPNHLTMKGSLWEDFNLAVSGKFPRVDLIGELVGAPALGGKSKVEGRLTGPSAFQGTLTWDSARFLQTDFKTIRGKIHLRGRRLVAPRLVVTRGKTTGTIHLRLALPEKETALDLEHDLHIEAEGQITGTFQDVFSLLGHTKVPLAGRMTFEASVKGVPARMAGRGHVHLSDATVLGEPWQDIMADVVLEPNRLLFEKVRLARGTQEATGSGLVRFEDGGTNFRLATTGLTLEGFHLLAGTGLEGMMDGELYGEGNVNNPTIRGDFTLTRLRYATIPLESGRYSFLLQDHKMTAQLALPKRGYSGQGTLRTVRPYAYSLDVTMKQAELAPLFALSGLWILEGGTGTGSGTAHVRGNLEARDVSQLTLDLEAPSMRIHGKAFHTVRPFRLEMSEDGLTLSSLAVTGKEGWLNAQGQIAYQGAVDIDAKGKIPLAVLLPRPGTITGIKGSGHLDLKVSGLWKAPRYTGRLVVARGSLRLAEHPELLWGIKGRVDFQGWKIHVPPMQGRWGGGKVKLSGTASRRRGKQWRWVLDLVVNQADAKRVSSWTEKGKGRVTGRADFSGKLTAEGRRWAELQRSVGGNLRLDFKEGKFNQYTVLANIVRILNLTPDPTSGVPYDHFRAVFHLRRGVAETQDLLFLSDTMKVGGVGKIDLGRREVDMLLGVQPLRTVDKLIRGLQLSKVPILGHLLFGKEESALVISMKVAGPLKAPEVSMVPHESLGRGIFGIFRRLLELPAELFPARSSRRSEK